MTTSDQISFLYEIQERKPISDGKLAFFQTRLKWNLYDFVLSKFVEMEEKEGLTKAELARRIGCEPAQITRWLGAPGNWTLDTISDLLIGICGEELQPKSVSVFDGPKRNNKASTWRVSDEGAQAALNEPSENKVPAEKKTRLTQLVPERASLNVARSTLQDISRQQNMTPRIGP